MRQVFDSVTDVSLWLASQGFFVTLLLVLIPYAIISFPVQYGIRRLLRKHEFENNDFAYPMVAGILNGVTGLTIAFVVVTLWNHHREQDAILKKEAQAIENIHMIEVLEKPAAGPVIRLHEADNVVIARSNVEIGTKLGDGLTCRSQVPSGHKIATRAIKKGEPILKYNVTIGFAATDIAPGTFVHSHNMLRDQRDRRVDHRVIEEARRPQLDKDARKLPFPA